MQGYLLHVMGCLSGQGSVFDQPKTAEQIAADFIRLPPEISQAS
jgi:EAL domain-containing protein (putative c-di-GMP-specific phosphodiesterase class I)